MWSAGIGGRCFEILGGRYRLKRRSGGLGGIPNIVSHGMSNGNISEISPCLVPSVIS